MTRTARTPAPGNIYNIPSGIGFADVLAQTVLRDTKSDPLKLSETLILLPSRRACRTVRDAFLRHSPDGRPTILPRLQPLGDVDAEELSITFSALDDTVLDIPPPISALRRQVLLARTILKLYENILPRQQQPRFDQATLLAAELAALLDEVQTENVPFDRLQDLVPDDFADHWKITLDFLKILTENWPDILAAEGVIDPAARRNALLSAQAELWRKAPPQTPVIAAGTTASIPATLDLLKIIAGLPQGQIILPGLDRHMEEDVWHDLPADHPQYFLQKLLNAIETPRNHVRDLGNSAGAETRARLWSETLRPAATTRAWQNLNSDDISAAAVKGMTLLTAKTPLDEAETIAVILREALETPDKTATVVTPDRNLARRISAALTRWGIQVDDSGGRNLDTTPAGGWSLAVGDMLTTDFAPVPLLTALRHPMAQMGYEFEKLTPVLNMLDMHILRGPRPAPGISGLRERLSASDLPPETTDALTEMLDRLTAAYKLCDFKDMGERPFTAHLKSHITFLEALARTPRDDGATRLWHGDDGEALSRFFAEVFQLGDDIPPMTFDRYLLTLRQLMSQNTIRPRYGTHPRITILGQIEARLTTADTIIIAGLNEGTWPAETRNDPWMSRQMRHGFGLPAREQSIGIAAHDFCELASAPRVILTRAERADGAMTVPSRWLLRLETVLSAVDLSLSVQDGRTYEHWKDMLDRPADIIPMARPAPCPPISARPRQLSVTGIERLMRDPYEVFARYILKLRALEDIDADPAAAQRGQLLHAILEKFVSTYPDNLPPNAANELRNLGRTEFSTRNIPVEIESFWWPRFERLVDSYIDTESAWRKTARPCRTESRGHLNMNIDNISFRLTAFADRIDRTDDEKLAIIDYKTGSKPSKTDIDLGFAPQLWLEALIAYHGGFENIPAANIAYLGFWMISGGTAAKINEPVKCDDISGTLATTDTGLRRVLAHFFTEHATYIARPDPDMAPRYSDYTHLERIQEWMFEQEDSV